MTQRLNLSDDEAIALAMLHGADMQQHCTTWIIGTPQTPVHPIEIENDRETRRYGFESCAAIARAYCRYYKLDVEQPHETI
jgi:hypothetical protein